MRGTWSKDILCARIFKPGSKDYPIHIGLHYKISVQHVVNDTLTELGEYQPGKKMQKE
jgi:hypothetical protein